MEIYINGKLESFTTFSGQINPSPVDLEIGQIMPDDPSYNFGGVLDEVKIFDYALLPDSVFTESGQLPTSLADPNTITSLDLKIYPNPAHDNLTIQLADIPAASTFTKATYHIINALGQEKLTGTLNHQSIQNINITTLSPGMYFLQIKLSNKTWTGTCRVQ
jgi:hypothetical protein